MRFPGYDIIMMALARWDRPYSSTAYSLAKELSRHTRVFYIDNPVSLNELVRNINTGVLKSRMKALFTGEDFFLSPDPAYPNLFAVTPRITLPINWLAKGLIYDAMSRVNDSIVSGTLNHLIRIFGVRKYVLVNSFNPLFGRAFSLSVKPILTVYQTVDDISQTPYMTRHGLQRENEATASADFTLVTSSHLKRLKSLFSQRVFLLPNAANTSLFRQAVREGLPCPEEIKQIAGRKVICYIGNICHRLDYQLLQKVAVVHSDKIMLMIGPAAQKDYGASALAKFPNVLFTGAKPQEELPAYLKFSHCCIIPFLCNQLTKSIYPLKVNEYLSAGKPVVTTNFSEDILEFKKVAYISNGHSDFIDLIEHAINTDTEKHLIERMIFSSSNDWEARAHRFIDITVEFLKHDERGRGKPGGRKREPALQG